MIILGLKFGFIVTEVPIWIEAVTMTMIIWDAMISPHTMYHNQVVVTSAAMMSSSEALPGGKGAEKSDWCVTGWSIVAAGARVKSPPIRGSDQAEELLPRGIFLICQSRRF